MYWNMSSNCVGGNRVMLILLVRGTVLLWWPMIMDGDHRMSGGAHVIEVVVVVVSDEVTAGSSGLP